MNDLDNLTLKELHELRAKVERVIISFEERKRREAMAAAEAAAREHGFSLNELTGAKVVGRRGGKVAPKYANPQKPDMAWTGRGRRPQWVQDAVATGKSLDDRAV